MRTLVGIAVIAYIFKIISEFIIYSSSEFTCYKCIIELAVMLSVSCFNFVKLYAGLVGTSSAVAGATVSPCVDAPVEFVVCGAVVAEDSESLSQPVNATAEHAAIATHINDFAKAFKKSPHQIFSILLKLAIRVFVPALSKATSSIVSLPIFSVFIIIPLPNTLWNTQSPFL